MKNILVPTSFEPDTLHALTMSSDFRKDDGVHITLLSVSALSDSITELLFPSQWKTIEPGKRETLLTAWAKHNDFEEPADVKISEHHQHGVSKPILKQLLERFGVDMVIVPFSFHQSKEYVHKMLLSLLRDCNVPLMLLPGEQDVHAGIYRALYLDNDEPMPAELMEDFPFHVIHQSMVKEDGLSSIIKNFKINLIVLDRGNERSLNERLAGLRLPVLTI